MIVLTPCLAGDGGRQGWGCLCSHSQIIVPPLPGKALGRQLPFRKDDGIFEEEFIEERRQGLEEFINKFVMCFMLPCMVWVCAVVPSTVMLCVTCCLTEAGHLVQTGMLLSNHEAKG